MGILTQLLTQASGQLLDFGFDQLDALVTRKIQEGNLKGALEELDKYAEWGDQQVAQRQQQGGVLPLDNGPNAAVPLPGQSGPMRNGAPTDWIPNDRDINFGKILGNPTTAEQFRAQRNLYMSNDPYYVQQEMDRKRQESEMQALQTGLGTLVGQGNVAPYEATAFMNKDPYFSVNRLQEMEAQGAGRTETAQEMAKEPGRIASHKRALERQQAPHWTKGGGGDGGGGAVNAIGPAFPDTVTKNLLKYSIFTREIGLDDNGNKVYGLNEAGQLAKDNIINRYSSEKKPNYYKIEADEVAKARAASKEVTLQEHKRIKEKGINMLGVDVPTVNTPPEGAKPQPSTKIAAPSRQNPTTVKMIDDAKNLNATPQEIHDAIIDQGEIPEDYGY